MSRSPIAMYSSRASAFSMYIFRVKCACALPGMFVLSAFQASRSNAGGFSPSSQPSTT